MKTIFLKPCPICGLQPIVTKNIHFSKQYAIYCKCFIRDWEDEDIVCCITSRKHLNAIAKWNKWARQWSIDHT